MNIKNFFSILFFSLLFCTGCDTDYDRFYEVENQTDEVVRIELRYTKADRYLSGKDSIFTIEAGAKAKLFRRGGFNMKKYVPEDLYSDPDMLLEPFDKFAVYAGSILLNEDLRYRKYWEYSAKKLLGVYTLRITKEFVSEIAAED
jgi:hypothetical protein